MARWAAKGLAWAALICAIVSCARSTPPPIAAHTDITRQPAAGEPPVRILSERRHYVIDQKGGYRLTLDRRYRILTLAGVESWAETGFGWSPWYQARPQISAEVASAEGTVSKLDPKTIAEEPAHPDAPDIYGDQRVLRAPLPAIAVGAVVHERIVARTTQPYFEGGSGHYVVMQNSIPRDQMELVIDVPADLPFRYAVRDAKLAIEDSHQAGRRRLVFRGGPFPGIEPVEPLVPSDVAAWPHVQFSTAESWNKLARAYGKIVDTKLRNTGLEATARGLVRPEDTLRVKANKLADWIRARVRYAGIEFGEASIIPRKPTETLQRGYGDCKDQSLLLVGLLRSIGIDAKVALLRGGGGEDVLPSMPTLDAFNHLIVVVPGQSELWIDLTSPYARAGDLPEHDQGRLALVIDDRTEQLRRTPEATARDNGYQETRDIRLSDLGAGRVVETSSMSGTLEQQLRSNLDLPQKTLKEQMTKYVVAEYAAKELVRLDQASATDLSKPFRLVLEATNAGKAQTGIFDAYVVIDHRALFAWLPSLLFEEEPRKTDLLLTLPYRAELRYRIVPPDGYTAATLPVRQTVNLGPAKLERSFQALADGTVTATLLLDTGKRRWTPAEVKAFKDGNQRLASENQLGIGFDHKAHKLIESRRTREGLDVFRKLAATHSKQAIHRIRLATALFEIGFGDQAKVEARRAIAVEPNSAAAHRSLGEILRADQFGRAFQQGYDRAGALAEFRKAAELDASDVASQIDVALLLEHDDRGTRYGDPKQLADAIAQYDAIDAKALAEYGDGEFKHNALFALTYAGRFTELEQRLRKLSPEETPAALAILAVTAQSGPVSGIARADSLGLRGDARSDSLSGAGEMLVVLRRYSDAASLISAAAAGSARSVQLTNRSRLLVKVKKIDPPSMKADSPSKLVTKAFALYVGTETVGDAAKKELFSARALSEPKPQPVVAFESFAWAFHRSAAVAREVAADTLSAMTETKVEGDARTGYRVKTTMSAPGSPKAQLDVFVVREAGGHRIRAVGEDSDELGAEAFYLANRGDTKQATRWLEWAKEHVTAGSGQDALRVPPFLELFQDGKGDPKVAAAALCGMGSCVKQARAPLEAALAQASTDRDRSALEYALVLTHLGAKDAVAALDKARSLTKRHPSSKIARSLELTALWDAKRFNEYRDSVRKQIAKASGDDEVFLHGLLAAVSSRLGRFGDSKAAYQVVIDRGNADAHIYNNRAWLGLFLPKPSDEDVGFALQATQLSQFQDVNSMHTLATLYAEIGKTEEAWQTFLKLLELRPDRRPEGVDWYIVGRIAEHYSLFDSARNAYGRVPRDDSESPIATYVLAQRRLKALPSTPPAESGIGSQAARWFAQPAASIDALGRRAAWN